MSAVASAMPSINPTVSIDAPSTLTRNSGSRLWINSDDVSMSMDTKPSVHTPAGIARQPEAWRRVGGGLLGKIERRGEIAHLRAHAGQRLELESTRDELGDRCRIVGRVIDVAAVRIGRNDDRGDARSGSPAIARRRRHMIPPAAVFVV